MRKLKRTTIRRYSAKQIAAHMKRYCEHLSKRRGGNPLFRVDLRQCTIYRRNSHGKYGCLYGFCLQYADNGLPRWTARRDDWTKARADLIEYLYRVYEHAEHASEDA